ncbi:hypothetical protein EJ04DRAFT_364885 [Polyplosphaeria fusca]|uniref:Transcription factor IIA, alpha/beta subunit n=1 Tax=Polyplosphaeria fusca TaxID=682080 RepID=A0A9P4QQ21_9PLEO|nr:hypothetical protein EJ04DRAFT_364885 [Polyplosphaeria fusca]
MSNQVVGGVFKEVIERCVAASLNDFEEFGIDRSTLDELRTGWQEKLSSLHIAAFPWDPQPEPPRQTPTVPSNVKQEADVSPAVAAQQEHMNFPNVPIKTERGYETPMAVYPQHAHNGGFTGGGLNADMAAQRANALIAQRQGLTYQQQQQQQQQQPAVAMPAQQRMMHPQPQQRGPQQMARPQQNHVQYSQADGTDGAMEDWQAAMAAKMAAGEEGRIAADQLMRSHVDAMAATQDSGLMMPLDSMPKGKKRKAIKLVLQAQQGDSSSSGGVASFDGEAEEEPREENPEDAINSDLDDPEDELDGDGSDDDTTMDYMLCTYDKVQRVKNKWKCTLKDGVLMTGKKEYLFHKANGEFEW